MSSSVQRRRGRPRTSAAAGRQRRKAGRPPAGTQTVGREALLAQTCELLHELPPSRLTRAEVARRLHVDPSLIRYYFDDRRALLLAALEQLTGEFMHLLEREIALADKSAEGQLRARVTALFRFETSYPFFHRLLLEEIVPQQSPQARQFVAQLTRRAFNAYREIVARGVSSGEFRQVDERFLYLSVVGLCEFYVQGLPILRASLGDELDERATGAGYLEFIIQTLLNGLRPQRAP